MMATAGPERSGSGLGVPVPSITTCVTGDAACARTAATTVPMTISRAKPVRFIGRIIQFKLLVGDGNERVVYELYGVTTAGSVICWYLRMVVHHLEARLLS